MKKDRFGIVIFFFILFFVFLEIRIVWISLFPDPRLTAEHLKAPSRGTIFDCNNKELAVSTPFYSFYARPSQLSDQIKNTVYSDLSQNSFLSTNELMQLFSQDKGFTWIKRKMKPQEAVPVKELLDYLKKNNLATHDELGIVAEQGRIYPCLSALNTVGVVGMDNNGLSGLEHSLNGDLEKGKDVYTTLDSTISAIVFDELKKGISENQAENGSAAIIDIDSREIIAMVSFPTFDPYDYKSITPFNMKCRAVSEIIEPGSVMKQFSAAFALNTQIVTPLSPAFNCTGHASIMDQDFSCDVAHGSVTLSRIIQKSCNIGMIQVADHFKKADFYQFLQNFGFGQTPPLPLANLESGILRPVDKWSGISKYMISIGQEIGVTAAQLMIASSVIGSGGIYQTPVLVRSITDRQNKNTYSPEKKVYRVIQEVYAMQLLKMMETVVSENGTAIAARVEGIPIAGKTGTGQVAKEGGGGYYKDLYNSVFIGYIPANKPKFAAVIVISKPHGTSHTGGLVAAPVFGNIMRRMITSTTYFTNFSGGY